MVLGRLARDKSSKSRRKLNFTGRPRGISLELHKLLKELAPVWRDAFRNFDRDSSARILQLTLKAIPPLKGRVSDWLGPKYFDQVKSVNRESPIRLLKLSDVKNRVTFRNGFANSSLINGIVTKLGQSECEIEVRENWGLRVVVKDKNGSEKVVWGHELQRCSKNKCERDDPYQAEDYHKRNRRTLKNVKVCTHTHTHTHSRHDTHTVN